VPQSFWLNRQIVELMMTIGFYMLVCRLLENLEVDLEQRAQAK